MDNDVSAVAEVEPEATPGGEAEKLFGAEKSADDRVSLPGEFVCKKTIEDRAKFVKERREQEKIRLLNELKMSEEKAEKIRRFKESERERKTREIREREQTRRDHVTERRKLLEQQELEKKRDILAKFAKENVALSHTDGGSGHDEFSSDTATSSPKFVPKKQTKTHSYAFGSSTPRGLTFLDQIKSRQRAEAAGHVTASASRLSSAVAAHLLGDGLASGRSTPTVNAMTTSVYVPRHHVSSAHTRVRVQPLSKDENSRAAEKTQSAKVQKTRSKAQNDIMTKSLILPKSTTVEKAYSASKPSKPSTGQFVQSRKKSVTKPEKSPQPSPVVQKLIPESELVENLSSIEEAKNDDLPTPELSKEPLSQTVDNENLDNLSTIVEVGSVIAEKSFESDEIMAEKSPKFDENVPKIDNNLTENEKIETENGEIMVEDEGGGVSEVFEPVLPKSDSLQQLQDQNGCSASMAASANQKTLSKVMTEGEAKAALAERRRLAREQMEREKELERRREEEQRLAEEEEFRRQEEEELRLLREARQAEEERLKMALEEQRLKKEEEEKRLQEEKQRLLEQELKNKEINEKIDKEREDKLRQEEIDRLERKKKLDAIRQRTRLATAESVPSNLADQSAASSAGAPAANNHVTMTSSGGSGPELTTLSIDGGESRDSSKESTNTKTVLSTRDSVGNILSRVRSKITNNGNGTLQNSADFTHITSVSIDQNLTSGPTVAPPMDTKAEESLLDNARVTSDNGHTTTDNGCVIPKSDHVTVPPNLHNLSTSTMSYFSQNSRKHEIGDAENQENGNNLSNFQHQINQQSASLSLPSFINQNNLININKNMKNVANDNDNSINPTTDFMVTDPMDLNANNAENRRIEGFSSIEIQNMNAKANSVIRRQNEYFQMNGEDLINENNLHNGDEQNLGLDHKKPDLMNF